MELQIEEIKELVMKLLEENNAEYLSDDDKVNRMINYVIDNVKIYSEVRDKYNYSCLLISIPMYNDGKPMLYKIPSIDYAFPSTNSVYIIPSVKEKRDSPIKIILSE